MTENKRFTFIHFDWLQWHIYDNESLLCEVTDDEDAENLCKLLNGLHKKYIDEYTLRETLSLELQRVEEENKELKNKINTYKSANKLQQETIRLLREDNGLINITNVELFKLEDEDD